jgi:hypothetical protein
MCNTGWFKSTHSDSGNDSCVEVRIDGAAVAVRDTKDRDSGMLDLTAGAWEAFLGLHRS